MASLNSTVDGLSNSVPVFGPLIEQIHNLLGVLQWLVGGAIGLFIIFSLIKMYQTRSMEKRIINMQKQIHRLERKIDKNTDKKDKK